MKNNYQISKSDSVIVSRKLLLNFYSLRRILIQKVVNIAMIYSSITEYLLRFFSLEFIYFFGLHPGLHSLIHCTRGFCSAPLGLVQSYTQRPRQLSNSTFSVVSFDHAGSGDANIVVAIPPPAK